VLLLVVILKANYTYPKSKTTLPWYHIWSSILSILQVTFTSILVYFLSFLFSANKIPHLRHDKDITFYFDTSDVSPSELVMGAEFRLFKEAKRNRGAGCRIELYRIAQGQDSE